MRTVDIFIAYSHNDLGHKNELKKFLRPLINTGQARLWDDHEIEGGQDWEAEIKKRLYGSDIILLLVSPDSLASEYFYGQEVKVSLERHDKGEAVVVPVILRPCTWTLTPLKRLEALPEKARPVTSWTSQDEAYTDIAHHIGAIVESRQAAIAAATAQETQRREFAAAAEAAEHLFHKKQWAEAQKAFTAALQLYQPGFLPDRSSLQNRIAACVSEQQQADAHAAWEDKKKEYQGLLDAAEYSENPKQAVQYLQKALALYQPGFPENPEALNERIRQLRAYKAPAPPVSDQPVPPFSSGEKPAFNTRVLLLAGVALVLVIVVLLVGRQFAGGSKPEQAGEKLQVTTSPTTVASFLVKIPGGTFSMGDQFGDGGSDEQPIHNVTLSDFYLSKYEVSFEEFDAFCSATGREKPSDSGWGRGKRPVINVDWYDAVEYCNWLSAQHGLKAVYSIDKNTQDTNNQNTSDTKKWSIRPDWTANGYRLPTEAEWEYAARALSVSGRAQGGGKVRFGNGRDVIDPSEINFDASSAYKKTYSVVGEYRQQTVPVDALSANAFGLKNMSGNVWEWCWDWYDGDIYKNTEGARDPKGETSGTGRVLRGGSWYAVPEGCRASYRVGYRPYDRNDFVGFRVARHL